MKLARRDFLATQMLLEGATLQQVGNMFGVTRQRAEQITSKVFKAVENAYDVEFPGTRTVKKQPDEWVGHVEKLRKESPEAWI